MAMKGYSTFHKVLKLEPHHQMQFTVILGTFLFVQGDGKESYSFAVDTISAFSALVMEQHLKQRSQK